MPLKVTSSDATGLSQINKWADDKERQLNELKKEVVALQIAVKKLQGH